MRQGEPSGPALGVETECVDDGRQSPREPSPDDLVE
jgi:hypothetical protein